MLERVELQLTMMDGAVSCRRLPCALALIMSGASFAISDLPGSVLYDEYFNVVQDRRLERARAREARKLDGGKA